MKTVKYHFVVTIAFLSSAIFSCQSFAAISLDRTRVIVEEGQQSVSLSISNDSKTLPYLAQGWVEDDQGHKIQSPLTVLPPVQRVEPGTKSQVKVQTLPAISSLPKDRESLYYFNLREIPPRSNKPNSLQLALQTRVKLFFRPAAIIPKKSEAPWQENITLTRQGEHYQINNPTAFYVTISAGTDHLGGNLIKDFKPVMVEPKGQATINVNASELGHSPVLTYINDFGGRPELQFKCNGNVCTASPVKKEE